MSQTSRRARARRILLTVVAVSLVCFAAYAQRQADAPNTAASGAEERLLETGRAAAATTSAPEARPRELKIVSYNIRWRGGEDLRRLAELLKTDAEIGGASIIGLQEVDRNKERTRNVNTARELAESLGMHYAWAAPPSPPGKGPREEETGVAILSKYPLTDVVRIVLPHEGPGKRRRAAVGATAHVGATPLRVYSVHAETRIQMERKVEQFAAVLEDWRRHNSKVERAAVMGDLNTIKDKDVKGCIKLFEEAGFTTPLPHDRSTFKVFLFKLKLDWVWLRGLEAADSGIDREVGLSDHWPLWVKVKLDGDKTNDPKTDARSTASAPQAN